MDLIHKVLIYQKNQEQLVPPELLTEMTSYNVEPPSQPHPLDVRLAYTLLFLDDVVLLA